MTLEEVQMNDKHIKSLRSQDIPDIQDEIQKKVKKIEAYKKQFDQTKVMMQNEIDEIKKVFSKVVGEAATLIG